MKKIYYFSATGNTLYLAKYLKEQCGYEVEDISIIKLDKITLSGEVGLLFPIYAMGIPKIVEEFTKKLELKDITYLFAIATCGGSGYGIAPNQLNRLLGRKLDYFRYCHMPDNYLKLFVPLDEDKAKKDIDNKKMTLIKDEILIHKNFIEKSNPLLYPVFSFIYNFWRLGLKKGKRFTLENEKCISCGVCKSVCPVGNIELINGKPTWKNHCEDCLACANLCPTVAIYCGGKSKLGKRYKNPYISINELKK